MSDTFYSIPIHYPEPKLVRAPPVSFARLNIQSHLPEISLIHSGLDISDIHGLDISFWFFHISDSLPSPKKVLRMVCVWVAFFVQLDPSK